MTRPLLQDRWRRTFVAVIGRSHPRVCVLTASCRVQSCPSARLSDGRATTKPFMERWERHDA
jgi:hypothetical protein